MMKKNVTTIAAAEVAAKNRGTLKYIFNKKSEVKQTCGALHE